MKEGVVELYGRGHSKYIYGKNYKGELNYDGNCKYLGLYPYEYSIVLENSQERNYWTEKLADAYLSWCIPIYWGCPNISDFFSPQTYRIIRIDDKEPTESLNNILENPITSEDICELKRSRDKILDEYNIWEVVRKKIEEIECLPSE
jgi:hypothetical protein